ncbi:MAG: sigma-70 family RNA polymerase sigma factor [Alicyclobacillus sp.]|nr:sigma-70 family RNA polymerase sigma factor [Alicyclobacillus sp.]
MTEVVTDAELMKRVANRDRAALEAIYDRYERIVYGFARKSGADGFAAEEIVQDVFTKVWNAAGSYDEHQAKFSTWLLTIARRTAIDHARKRQRVAPPSAAEETLQAVPDGAGGPEEVAEVRALQQMLRAALSELPVDQKWLIERIYLQGLTQREVAELLGLPMGTVKSRLRLGLTKLRDKLAGTGWEVTP